MEWVVILAAVRWDLLYLQTVTVLCLTIQIAWNSIRVRLQISGILNPIADFVSVLPVFFMEIYLHWQSKAVSAGWFDCVAEFSNIFMWHTISLLDGTPNSRAVVDFLDEAMSDDEPEPVIEEPPRRRSPRQHRATPPAVEVRQTRAATRGHQDKDSPAALYSIDQYRYVCM